MRELLAEGEVEKEAALLTVQRVVRFRDTELQLAGESLEVRPGRGTSHQALLLAISHGELDEWAGRE
jgi:hypothetical protein